MADLYSIDSLQRKCLKCGYRTYSEEHYENAINKYQKGRIIMESKMKEVYEIELIGCDDTTSFTVLLSKEEYELIKNIEVISNDTSTYGCMPILEIIKKEEE